MTAEVSLWLAPVPATRMARSALTFSSEGKLGVRVVGEGDKVAFLPVALVEDEADYLWVSGIPKGCGSSSRARISFARASRSIPFPPPRSRGRRQA